MVKILIFFVLIWTINADLLPPYLPPSQGGGKDGLYITNKNITQENSLDLTELLNTTQSPNDEIKTEINTEISISMSNDPAESERELISGQPSNIKLSKIIFFKDAPKDKSEYKSIQKMPKINKKQRVDREHFDQKLTIIYPENYKNNPNTNKSYSAIEDFTVDSSGGNVLNNGNSKEEYLLHKESKSLYNDTEQKIMNNERDTLGNKNLFSLHKLNTSDDTRTLATTMKSQETHSDSKMSLPDYNFHYEVSVEQTKNDFGHSESRKGTKATGQYFVRMPDGHMQMVRYVADSNGYRPKITYL